VLYSPHRNAPSTQQLLGLRFLRQERQCSAPCLCAKRVEIYCCSGHSYCSSFVPFPLHGFHAWVILLPTRDDFCLYASSAQQNACEQLCHFWLCEISCGDSRYSSWVTGPKDSRLSSSNHFFAVISQTRPPGIRWNDCEDINYFSIWFLSSISHVVLPTLIYVSAAVTNSVPRANSFAITMQSWPSYKRGTSDQFWDVGWVLSRNFIGSHSPPLVAFSGPSKSL
jgi:hypothetical protein